ncbi:MAG TPA: TIGR01777 family protein [Bacteroidetes bacterium]|nr:TIGR01777 family protein [Bacteroidota bacterium]
MKNILLFGGTGFIGRHLVDELKYDDHITVISRNPAKYKGLFSDKIRLEKADFSNPGSLVRLFDKADAIINLAGENVGSRWTSARKQAIQNSRLDTDKLIVVAFNACTKKPAVVIQGSGMGVYGFETSDEPFTEDAPLGTTGFLTEVGIAHENALEPLKDKTRVIFLRTGLVLDGKGGALPMMAASFKIFLGGPMGNGKFWNSWIHIDDEVRAIRFLLENEQTEGAYNLTSPNPIRNKNFALALGKALHRPARFHTPAAFLKIMMGNMADELLLSGLKIIPKRLLDARFMFEFQHIEEALKEVYQNK